MGKGRLGIISGGVALIVLLGSRVPVSAISIFGLNFSASRPTPAIAQTSTDQQMENGISKQAESFLNDMVANANENTCFRYTNHEYEVCTAYLFNSSFADLVPYYKYANSANASAARFANYRLSSRYIGQANEVIRERAAKWPTGDYDVDVPGIKILAVNSSLATNTATLRTQEYWRVTDGNGNVVYLESGMYHNITMARVPSYLLHKWVVTDLE